MQITDTIWCSLSCTAEQITNKIIADDKIPGDLSKDTIKSEVYRQIGYLINNYKDGTLSLKNYCWKYAPVRVISQIWKEYAELNDAKLVADVDFENDYNESYMQPHEHLKLDYEYVRSLHEEIESAEAVEQIKTLAKKTKFDKILKMLENEMTERDIADVLDMSLGTVHNRIVQFRKLLEEMKNK